MGKRGILAIILSMVVINAGTDEYATRSESSVSEKRIDEDSGRAAGLSATLGRLERTCG